MSSRRLLLTQSSGGGSHLVHSWCEPMTITGLHICLPWVSFKGLQWCKPQWLSPHRLIQHPAWHLKVESKHQNIHQTYKKHNGGRFNSERESYLFRTNDIIGISLKRHLRLRLLLQHSGKANNTSRVPWCQQCWQNHIMLT